MRCSECGREIPDDSVFCPECGKQQTIGQKPQKEKMKRCTNCGCKIPEDSSIFTVWRGMLADIASSPATPAAARPLQIYSITPSISE